MKKKLQSEKGQTLVLAILIMIIILFAIVFMFDYQNVVRGKIKSQMANDAAAIAGANWQMHSLNLIGELNLVKACDVMLTDFSELEYDLYDEEGIPERQRLMESSAIITEMQQRVGFIGPMIGYAAAQTAAKNNGIIHTGIGDYMQAHIELLEADVYTKSDTSFMKEAYLNMIKMIADSGVAIFCYATWAQNPQFENSPYIGYLSEKSFYENIETAIAHGTQGWCDLKTVLESMHGTDETTKWWGTIIIKPESINFTDESEYFSLNISHSGTSGNYYAGKTYGMQDLLSENNRNLEENSWTEPEENDYLPWINWTRYASETCRWQGYGETMIESWNDDYFAERGDILEKYQAYSTGAQTTTEIALPVYFGKKISNDDNYIGDDLFMSDNKINNSSETYGKKINKAERKMTETVSIKSKSLAKVFGSITPIDEFGNPLAPVQAYQTEMVLPIFDKTSIIPNSLEKKGGDADSDIGWFFFLREYLPTLGTVDNLSDMPSAISAAGYGDHWHYFAKYHNLLLQFNDPEWRKQGWNNYEEPNGWLDTPITELDEFGEEVPIPGEWNWNSKSVGGCLYKRPIHPGPPGPGPPPGPGGLL